MRTQNNSETEWTVIEAIWDHSPQTAFAFAKSLQASTEWAENTVHTLMRRLEEKGA